MNVKIESPVLETLKNYASVTFDFINIFNTIAMCSTREQLASEMNKLELTQFVFGFGGSHMWLKQINADGRIITDRILMVEFI